MLFIVHSKLKLLDLDIKSHKKNRRIAIDNDKIEKFT